jgi:hypothetical protein
MRHNEDMRVTQGDPEYADADVWWRGMTAMPCDQDRLEVRLDNIRKTSQFVSVKLTARIPVV